MKITRQTIKEMRLFRKASGVLLIIIGAGGIILPILPGWILIFIGLSLLGINLWFVELAKEYAIKKTRRAKNAATKIRKNDSETIEQDN